MTSRLSGSFLAAALLVTAAEPDWSRLEQTERRLAAMSTHVFYVVHKGRVVHEWYAEGWNAARPHYTASMAKAIVGGVSLLIAMDEGRIHPDDLASKYIPAWKDDPRKGRITIRHLATHSSGIEDAEQDDLPHNKLTGWKGAFWRRDPDPFSIALRDAPVIAEPGAQFHYSNPGMAALAYAVTKALGRDIRSAMQARVFEPLGLNEKETNLGYGRAYEVDGLKLYANWGGGSFSARAVAAIGRLMSRYGVDNGKLLFKRASVEALLADQKSAPPDRRGGAPAPRASLGWWNNSDGIWPTVPRDAVAGAGAGNQMLLVVPSLDLVVVRFGERMGDEFWRPAVDEVFASVASVLRQ